MRRSRVKREGETVTEKLHEEFAVFESTMRELYLLRLVAEDLKSFRRMIKLKRYD
jgi:hypothetical protein